MLRLTVLGEEVYDEKTNTFSTVGDFTMELEHSLVSLSKWESVWERPFLSKDPMTVVETLSYIEMMSLSGPIPTAVLEKINDQHLDKLNKYLTAKMSATWFRETPGRPSREVITSELIYYWMVSLNIPFECQHWHLSRLFTLIKVCNEKNAPPKKMSRSDAAQQQRELNRARLAQRNGRG